MTSCERILTTGDVARRYSVPEWKVRAFFGKTPPACTVRLGHLRGVREADLGAVEDAMRLAGILPAVAKEQPCP